jgi:hypothetical protein
VGFIASIPVKKITKRIGVEELTNNDYDENF